MSQLHGSMQYALDPLKCVNLIASLTGSQIEPPIQYSVQAENTKNKIKPKHFVKILDDKIIKLFKVLFLNPNILDPNYILLNEKMFNIRRLFVESIPFLLC